MSETAIIEFLNSCGTGDVEKVIELLKNKEIDINSKQNLLSLLEGPEIYSFLIDNDK